MKNLYGSRGWNSVHPVMMHLACVAWLAWAGGSAQAANMSWTNSAGGDYTNAANWNSTVPGTNDVALFNINAFYNVNLTAPAVTNNALGCGATYATVGLNLNGNSLSFPSGYYSATVGATGTNTLIVSNGTLNLGNYTRIAGGGVGTGALIISNVNLVANSIGVASADGGPIGNGTFNMYASTATVYALSVGASGGATTVPGGTGSVLIANGSVMTVSAYYSSLGGNTTNISMGTITVSNGVLNCLGGLTVGADYNNIGNLNILGNSTVYYGGDAWFGHGGSASGSMLIDGTHALFACAAPDGLWVGNGAGATSQVTIRNGSCVVSNDLTFGQSVGTKGVLLMTGGSLNMMGVHTLFIGGYYSNPGATGEVWLVGNGNPVINCLGYVALGGPGGSATLVVSNGMCHVVKNLTAQAGAVAQIVVAGGTVQVDGTLAMGNNWGTGTVVIANGGVLEANTLSGYATTASNLISVINSGGTYQYTNASPTITPGAFGNVSISNGTVSFRAITNADVTCNQGTKALRSDTVMLWAGTSNIFRLNNATNSGTINQTYTFAPGIATNFARLELLNSSTYRNGRVTIGANGSLYISGGASMISSVLTAAPLSTLEFDLSNTNAPGCLLSTTNVYLNGCTLQLDLANPPVLNTPFLIISNTLASQLSYSFAGDSTKQTFTVNGTNYLTTISLTGGGTEVVAQTTIPARGTSVFFH